MESLKVIESLISQCNIQQLETINKLCNEAITSKLKGKLKDFIGKDSNLDYLFDCCKEKLKICEEKGWDEQSKADLLDEINKHSKKEEKINCIHFRKNKLREIEHGFILRDNLKVMGILNNKHDPESIRQLTSSEKEIAAKLGLEVE